MANKSTQQYELLETSVDVRHERFDKHDALPQPQNQPSRFTPSRTGFAPHIAESTRPSKVTWLWVIFSHITVTAILTTAIVFGATKRTFNFNDNYNFLGIDLDVDDQFFFFGFFNKLADYVLDDSIERISGVLLTVWMAGNTRFPGILPIDFELSEEMSKPWRAVLNAAHRWKLAPSSNKSVSVVRVLSSLATSLTVLLLGGSFNVVAMPKVRWTGNAAGVNVTNEGESFENPTMRIDNLNWDHLNQAYSILGNNGNQNSQSLVGNTLAAMSVLDVLSNLVSTINEGSTWQGGSSPNKPGFVNLYTIQRGRPNQFGLNFQEPPLAVRGRAQTNANLTVEDTLSTMSIQEGPLYDFWSGNSNPYGVKAFGARNWFNFTLPILTTRCIDVSNSSSQDVAISVPVDKSSTFQVYVPGTSSSHSQQCQISVRQGRAPIYVYNSTQDARDEFNTPYSSQELLMINSSASEQNAAIASSLASKMNITLQYIELATGDTSATLFTSLTSTLTKEANSTYVNSTSMAMNYVIGSLAQHLITIATWEESETGVRQLVGPIQWQLYGSGPRLNWQWIIATVLGLAVVILGYDLFLMCYRQVMPGPWLSVPGMMVAANSAPSLRGPEDLDESAWRIGETTEDVERTKYCLSGGHSEPPELCRLDVRQRKTYAGE